MKFERTEISNNSDILNKSPTSDSTSHCYQSRPKPYKPIHEVLANVALHIKWSFLLKISSVNVSKSPLKSSENRRFSDDFKGNRLADLVTFTGKIFNGKLHFCVQCSDNGALEAYSKPCQISKGHKGHFFLI